MFLTTIFDCHSEMFVIANFLTIISWSKPKVIFTNYISFERFRTLLFIFGDCFSKKMVKDTFFSICDMVPNTLYSIRMFLCFMF